MDNATQRNTISQLDREYMKFLQKLNSSRAVSASRDIPGPSTSTSNTHQPASKKNALVQKKPRARRKAKSDSKDVTDNVFLHTLENAVTFYNSSYQFQQENGVVVETKVEVAHLENHFIEEEFTCRIKAGKSQGIYIRHRNKKCKRIKLKTFIPLSKPQIVFITKLCSQDLTRKFEKLSIQGTSTKKHAFSYRTATVNSEIVCDTDTIMSKRETTISVLNGPILQVPQVSTSGKTKRKREKRVRPKEKPTFEPYLTEQQVAEGLSCGEFIKGVLRINPKNFRDAYVSNEDTSQTDYYIVSILDRNRALEGDEVVLSLKPDVEPHGKKLSKVVYILDKVHPRNTVGFLKKLEHDTPDYALLHPRDKRVPQIRIHKDYWPNGFKENPKFYENNLFFAEITEWTRPTFAIGRITENLGVSGDLKIESLSILRECSLDTKPFPSSINQFLPKAKEIPEEEFEYREDIRNQCVFTIDPLTARDLDDAVSVRDLENGNYEIGVHISDVSFYLAAGTNLDEIVSKKATTIYMVDEVFHMLPIDLCLNCSLLPGEDKLTFSVFWEVTPEADVLSKRFARTVMNSCVQLAYEHAQIMLEDPERIFEEGELPKIHNGYTCADLSKTIDVLNKIATKLRSGRFEKGSLKIDQVKLSFKLDHHTGEPLEFSIYENKKSHQVIEEFMLLANVSVAQKIYEVFPDIAFLRRHEPPKKTMLVEVQSYLETFGLIFDISTSKGISSSLNKYITDDKLGQHRKIILNHLFAKPMLRARYFCTSTVDSEEDFHHFALNFDIYTHFTSPIRRYADIMVHRLMAAALGYTEKPDWNSDYVAKIAVNCNLQKYNAKRAGELCSDLYLRHYVDDHQPCLQEAVVLDVRDKSFDVIVISTGSVVRVYQHTCEKGTSWEHNLLHTIKYDHNDVERKVFQVVIKFPESDTEPASTLVCEIFTLVTVNLQVVKGNKLEAVLQRPKNSQQ